MLSLDRRAERRWPRTPPAAASVTGARPTFDEVYDQWFEHVARWLVALGASRADADDLAQEVFLVVHRKLPAFDGENLAGWLYQIARRKVSDHRRLAWIKLRFRGNPEAQLEAPGGMRSGSELLELREMGEQLEQLLAKLKSELRAAFVMFEILGYSGEEIAEVQGVALNTVWARIHTARKQLKERIEKLERARARRRP